MPSPRSYKAVFFDLDGTLLPMDTHEFMRDYFGALGAYFAGLGHDPKTVLEGIKLGTGAMFAFDGVTTNEQRFWQFFTPYMNERLGTGIDWMALLERFYADVFPKLGAALESDPHVPCVVDALHKKGYRLVLATNPLFPPEATAHRIAWTGANPQAFERVTAYHNSRYAKPDPRYYAENLELLGLAGADVLMVGNDPVEDYAACQVGCDLYLVTDNLLDRKGEGADLSATKHGTMADFARFVEELPAVK